MIDYPVIPENIVVHLGAPDSGGRNVTESFRDYIKNVASSEIYPTWPEEALRANIIAQISVALNRVYTEYYRSRGYDFDITDSPAYDQKYVYQRDIYDNVSRIVDEIFDTYLRRREFIEPLYAQFCDGVKVQCPGLSQWGTVDLAESGLSYQQILTNYYGNDVELVFNAPVENIGTSAPAVPLREGDAGRDIEQIQARLNRISANFPGIPKIYPADGFFGESTTAAVKKFQEVFSLTPDGIVGTATWYKIQAIYNAVKRLDTVNSEGLRISDISTEFTDTLELGDASAGVLVLQYYLSYISLYYPTVSQTALDGAFGESTLNSVKSFERTFGLAETGVVDRALWNKIQDTYYSIIVTVPFEYIEGRTLPFPGRVLRPGSEGDDVRVLQEYLNYIANTYTEIPKITVDGVYGPSTEAAVRAFGNIFGISGPERGRVSAATWNAITNVYSDLYYGSAVNEGQFPGYTIE